MLNQIDKQKKISSLRDYFTRNADVSMAFIFGSWAKDQEGVDSDIDIAVYLATKTNILEWQKTNFPNILEKKMWLELENIVGQEVDLIILNRSPATISDSAIRGNPLVIKDRNIYIDFLLKMTSEAIDFREWIDDYWKLREKIKYGITSN
ncbi:MAG: nucleotidyltransferase domain-containing protein [Candidatus Firestonebacteria bacterium]|nr:nucleotidyltransferase domain-containing protein [Candidatus Firestonebacteria bacterium]